MIGPASANQCPARLALEDGSIFTGRAFGACAAPLTSGGEVVFNTAMTGYQEAITDPSYAGQILTMTAPMIGNYGVNEEDVESARPQIAGFIVRELSRLRSNQRSTMDLGEWLRRHGVLGLEGIDTRALVRRLRISGSMRGVLSCDASRSDDQLIHMARQVPSMVGQNLAACVSPKSASQWSSDDQAVGVQRGHERSLRVISLDCGAKRNIYRHLAARGCTIEVMPHDCPAERIIDLKPDGLFISNGPGDPDAVDQTIATLRRVAGEVPTFGICLGHQLLALALGAKTYKLKFGHRGANQPVRNVLTGRVEITSQNHGFCVEAQSLSGIGAEMTHIHLNDSTLAGFRHVEKPIFCVQYHPEASPGPHDSAYLFDCFIEMMRTGRTVDKAMMHRAQSAETLLAAAST